MIGICGGLGFVLFSLLTRGDLISTEVISFELAHNGPAFLIDRLTYDCESPGTARFHGGLLYHVLLWGWLHLGHSELVMRAFTTLTGLAALVLLGWLVRPLGRSVALALVCLCITSPMLVNWFTSARAYGLFFLLCVASSGCLLALVRASTLSRVARWAALYLACAVAMLYTHHFAVHLLVAQGLFGLVIALGDRKRLGRVALSWVALGAGAAAALPLWPILQLHRLSRDLVGQPRSPWMIFGTWRFYTQDLFSRVFQQFDHFNLVGHMDVERVYVGVLLVLTVVGAVATWKTSRGLFAFLAVVFVFPLAAQAAVVAWTDHRMLGLRYFIYLVPVLHLPCALLVERLGKGGGRWRHPALPVAVLALALALNGIACAYGYSTMTWVRNQGVAERRDVIPDIQPWRMGTDWRGLLEHVRGQDDGSGILLTSTAKDAIYPGYYSPGESRVVSVGKGSHRPKGDGDERPVEVLDAIGCLGLPVWQISVGPMRPQERIESSTAVTWDLVEQRAFGFLELIQWEPHGTPRACVGTTALTILDARIGDRESATIHARSTVETALAVMARVANEPPFTAGLRVTVDGQPMDHRPIGASTALVHRFVLDVSPGPHEVEVEIVPLETVDPDACWSRTR